MNHAETCLPVYSIRRRVLVTAFERACKIMFQAPHVHFISFVLLSRSGIWKRIVAAYSILKIAAVDSSGTITFCNQHGPLVLAVHSIA
jgi:hypothetical protein